MNIIEIRDIKKTYYMGTQELTVLFGISLDIAEGDFAAIMGPSGSGKSTLLHVLGLLDKPTSGSYRIENREISKLNDSQLAAVRNRHIGYVFQSFNLLPRLSALENVLLPLVYADKVLDQVVARKKAKELLTMVGLGERMDHKPNELSGGQQQRVAIARALMNDPDLILADEPTGNLDSKSAQEIIAILKKLNDSGITVVMVTHEPDLAMAAKRTIRLQDGLVVSDERVSGTTVVTRPAQTSNDTLHHVFQFKRIKDYFSQALRALWSNKTRSVLSILGVLIGVTGLIAMLALGKGAQEETKKQMANLGSNLLMVSPGNGQRGGISFESGGSIRFTLEDADVLRRSVQGIAAISAYSTGRAQVSYGSKNKNTRVEGSSPDYVIIKNAKPVSGRFFTESETTSRAKVAVIGQTVLRDVFGDRDPLGEFIKINRVDFQVIGVLPAKGSSGWRDEDDKVAIPVNTAMYRLLGREYIDYIDVQVADDKSMEETSTRIKDVLLRQHRLTQDKSESIEIRNMADIQATVSATMGIFSTLLGSVAFISLLVGGIGIMNIMLVSVTERTREIGLRKALGADNNDILFQFVIEAVAICGVGGCVGIALGCTISVLLAVLAGWKTMIVPSSIVISFVFSVMIGLVFGTWPAKKAAKLNPIDALRYE
jgi:macrolide transport system ATP-binding/permease protein